MNKNNLLLGGVLIFIGASLFLKNFNINPADVFLLILGIYFLYLYNNKKQQPHLIIGGIAVTVSAVSILGDIRLFKVDVSGGVFFILIGAIFLFIYFNRGVRGFIFPGCLLPSIGIYTILVNNLNQKYSWPSIFLLLAAAFFVIYFIEYMDRETWTLLVGVFLFAVGIILYAATFGFIAVDISKIRNLIWPSALIIIGVILLIRNFKIGR